MKLSQIPRFLDICFAANLVPYLHGERGCGKSEVIQQYARNNNLQLIDKRLGQLEAGDLVGIPRGRMVDGVFKTVYGIPEWWPNSGKGILFFDEFNRAQTLDVIQAMFELILGEVQMENCSKCDGTGVIKNKHNDNKEEPCNRCDGKGITPTGAIKRKLHTHVLPEGWHIVCAGNPENANYITQTLDIAMLDRFVQVRVEKNFKESIEWMEKNFKHPDLVRFFRMSDKYLGETEPIDILVKSSNRSATFADRLLGHLKEEELSTIGPEILSGVLGDEIGTLCYQYLKKNLVRPVDGTKILSTRNFEAFYDKNLKKMLEGDKIRLELLNVTIDDIVNVVKERPFKKGELKNLFAFFKKIPIDNVIEASKEILQTKNSLSFIEYLSPQTEYLTVLMQALGAPLNEIEKTVKELDKLIQENEND